MTNKKKVVKRNKREEDNIFGDVIYSYTRAQALADGELVDVSEMARQAGIKYPTAVTRSLWAGYIKPEGRKDVDWKGRLWDVLFLFAMYAKRAPPNQNRIRFKCKLGNRTPIIVAHVGGGDKGEPVITIMLPEDD
jgi:hypothetical protein